MASKAPAPEEGGLTVRDQIERYRSAFISVVTMVVLAAAVGGTSSRMRTEAPGWCPSWGANTSR